MWYASPAAAACSWPAGADIWLCSTCGQLLCAPSALLMQGAGFMLPDDAWERASASEPKQCTATSLCR
jgi:hypothetical protein